MDGYDGTRCLAAVDSVNKFFETAVSGRVQLVLTVHTIVEGYLGMRKSLFFDEVCHIACLSLGLPEKSAADRYTAEEVSHDDGRTVRSTDLFQVDFDG